MWKDLSLSLCAAMFGGTLFYLSAAILVPRVRTDLSVPADRARVVIEQTMPKSGPCTTRVQIEVPSTIRISKPESALAKAISSADTTPVVSHGEPVWNACAWMTGGQVTLHSASKDMEIDPQNGRYLELTEDLVWDMRGSKPGVYRIIFQSLALEHDRPFDVKPKVQNRYEIRPDGSLAADVEVLSPNGITAENYEKLELAKNYSFGLGSIIWGLVVLLWRREKRRRETKRRQAGFTAASGTE